jgi:cardiolipin synthase
MTHNKESIVTLPNILSFYRLLTFPLILFLIYHSKETFFSWILCINLLTDIADGWIARRFNLQTKLGAKLDSLADLGTYISAFLGIFQFKQAEMAGYMGMLYLFMLLIVLYTIISLIKFRKTPSLHLYSTKIGGYIQGIFFFLLFAIDFYPNLFILAMVWGYLSSLEEIIILIKLKELRSNAKGLFWILKESNEKN